MPSLGRFDVASRTEWLRVALAAPVLVSIASVAFSILGRLEAWRPLAWIQAVWSRLLIRVLRVDVEFVGTEHLPNGPAVVLSLHEGFFDVPLLMRLGRPMRFIARDELFTWPALGRVLRTGGHILLPTTPSIGDLRRVRAEALTAIADGSDVVVFPQASILGIETAFAAGAQRIARSCNAPVVPIVITGTHRVWEHPFSNRLRFGQRVRVEILPAENPRSLDWGELESTMKTTALDQLDAPARRFVPERDGYWDGYRFEIDPRFVDVAAQVAAHRSELERGREGVGLAGPDEEPLPVRQM